jgi:hypothetical protein
MHVMLLNQFSGPDLARGLNILTAREPHPGDSTGKRVNPNRRASSGAEGREKCGI